MGLKRRVWPLLAAAGLVILLGGCAGSATTASVEPTALPDGTNAPAYGGTQVAAGSEEDFMVNVGRRTFFAQGSAELDETAKVTLQKQAQWLQQYPQWKVKLQGFADDPGGAEQNTALSQKRADAVRTYLASLGVAPDRMLAKGYGRDRLVQDCADISCKAQNRRVITNPQDEPEF